MNSILFFQIEEHAQYLDKFVKVFKSINRDKTGVIPEQHFRELIWRMKAIPDHQFHSGKGTQSEAILFRTESSNELQKSKTEAQLETDPETIIQRLLIDFDPHK